MNDIFKTRAIFRSLRYRNFRLFFGGQSVSLIGTWMQRISMPWLVFHLTGSAFWLGLIGFTSQIPILLISPLAGVLVDRWNRYNILIATQILAAVQALFLAILFFSGSIKVWQIFILSMFLGIINAFDMPARQALLTGMVKKKDDLGNAIALNSSMVNGARLIGPSLAGMLIAFSGEGLCFLFNSISYFFVIVALLLMKGPSIKRMDLNKGILEGLKNGASYVFNFRPIKYIILLLALMSLMGMPYSILMPVFVKNVLHGGAYTFGFLMGASGMGALVGAIYLASKRNAFGLEKIIPLSSAIFGLGIIILSFSKSVSLSFILMFITGIGMMMQLASSNTILQTIVDDDKRGRVMSIYTMAFLGTVPFGSLLAGSLASSIGTPNTLMICGIACVIGAAAFACKLADIKRMMRPIYVEMGIIREVVVGVQTATDLTSLPEE